MYKGTSPSCHDFNETVTTCDCAPLLVGFSTGQIQLVQPGKRETGRLYNEEVRYDQRVSKAKIEFLDQPVRNNIRIFFLFAETHRQNKGNLSKVVTEVSKFVSCITFFRLLVFIQRRITM